MEIDKILQVIGITSLNLNEIVVHNSHNNNFRHNYQLTSVHSS